MFRYTVDYWDEINQISAIQHGLIDEEYYNIAARELSDYYGEDKISSMRLEPLEGLLTDEDIWELMNEGE